jgi:hypothetical protein
MKATHKLARKIYLSENHQAIIDANPTNLDFADYS